MLFPVRFDDNGSYSMPPDAREDPIQAGPRARTGGCCHEQKPVTGGKPMSTAAKFRQGLDFVLTTGLLAAWWRLMGNARIQQGNATAGIFRISRPAERASSRGRQESKWGQSHMGCTMRGDKKPC